MAQINSIVGGFEKNYQRMSKIISDANAVDLIVFPECALCGYPQQDLLDYPCFAKKAEYFAQKLIEAHPEKTFLFGSVEQNQESGRPMRNVALFADRGKLLHKYCKRLLPTYDVFDEDRFFEPGREALVFKFKDEKLGITICEDIWNNQVQTSLHNRYSQYPLEDCKTASLIINMSASPFESAKVAAKRSMLKGIAAQYKKPLIYVNAVGANDSLIFDGRSYLWSSNGELIQSAKAFEEELRTVDSTQTTTSENFKIRNNEVEDIYDALVLGIRDYCEKTGFRSTMIGLSGGIDSSVLACLAADALGAEQVTALMMPSRYTSKESNEDALQIAKVMQNPLHIYIIEEIYSAAVHTLEMAFKEMKPDLTEENMQSRIRGMLLMAMSNKFGYLLLTTGNKSELGVGYCTLYGDMCGGLAPLADVYKTQVYQLGREANRRWQRIPERVFTKAPTAELRENQTDQDLLPPYEELDKILKHIIEDFWSREQLLEKGFSEKTIDPVYQWLGRNEYKRYQMPLGLKVSSKAFGIGRRMPLVHHFFG